MNIKHFLKLFVGFLCLVMAACQPQAPQPASNPTVTVTVVLPTQTPVPTETPAPTATVVVHTPIEGKLSFVKYVESSNATSYQSEDKVNHIRGYEQEWLSATNDPRVNGQMIVVINGDFQTTTEIGGFYGDDWGTISLTNSGGSWEGDWQGKREKSGYSTYKVVLKGKGGYEGLNANMDWERTDPSDVAPITIKVEIIETSK